ncbi:hypothetical protein SLEP1_g14812 [Rubroshorea leprosula]|uniref:RNase H type-1 domain-containing protein n=1 Tax=Rubroshorea leprosula TaxID=152421 RepID=A0AAV5IPP7_9ROSI|nr:hypothetical protein SLEP1_g14812 [Rubroshorea leprosula]
MDSANSPNSLTPNSQEADLLARSIKRIKEDPPPAPIQDATMSNNAEEKSSGISFATIPSYLEEDSDVDDDPESEVPIILLSKAEKRRIREPWANSLIIKAYAPKPVGYNFLYPHIKAQWKPLGKWDFIELGNDFFLRWEPNFDPMLATFSTTAIWARLPHLSADHYDPITLEKIGNKIDSHIPNPSTSEDSMALQLSDRVLDQYGPWMLVERRKPRRNNRKYSNSDKPEPSVLANSHIPMDKNEPTAPTRKHSSKGPTGSQGSKSIQTNGKVSEAFNEKAIVTTTGSSHSNPTLPLANSSKPTSKSANKVPHKQPSPSLVPKPNGPPKAQVYKPKSTNIVDTSKPIPTLGMFANPPDLHPPMESSPTSNPPPSPNPPVPPFNSQPPSSFSLAPLPFQSDEHPTLIPTHPTVGNFLTIQWRSNSIQSSPQQDVSLPTSENPLLVRTKDLCSLEKSSSERPMSYSRTHVYRKHHKPQGDHHPYYASEAHSISSRPPHSLDVIQGTDGEHPHSLQMAEDQPSPIMNAALARTLLRANNSRVWSTKIISWNYRSAAKQSFQSNAMDLKRIHNPCIMLILETKISGDQAIAKARALDFPHFHCVDSDGLAGGLWILWNDSKVTLDIVSTNAQAIHATVKDIGYIGPKFTWLNMRNNHQLIKECLDRAWANPDWWLFFPEANLYYLPRFNSDHHPIMLDLCPNLSRMGPRPFRMEKFWLDHHDFSQVISPIWSVTNTNSTESLAPIVAASKQWSKAVFRNIFEDKKSIIKRLNGIYRSPAFPHSSFLVHLERQLSKEYENILKMEKDLWFMKSRSNWLIEGDRNTKFFHISTVHHRARNRILGLKDSTGNWIFDPLALSTLIMNYFSGLFTTLHELSYSNSFASIDVSPRAIPLESLQGVSTKDEIWAALHSIKPFKASGPDGVHPLFFEKFWDITKDKLCTDIVQIFSSGIIPSSWNESLVVLIPKNTSPISIQEFRPIGLCNATYKVVSKILVNRLKPWMDKLISPCQSSFISGRQGCDNVLIFQELVHSFTKKNGARAGLHLPHSNSLLLSHALESSSLHTISYHLPRNIWDQIRAIPLSLENLDTDIFTWAHGQGRNFSSSSAYCLLLKLPSKGVNEWNWVWKTNTLPKIQHFLWLLSHKRLNLLTFFNAWVYVHPLYAPDAKVMMRPSTISSGPAPALAIEFWSSHQIPQSLYQRTHGMFAWSKPHFPTIKLNTDGSSIGNPSLSGSGGILKDSLGNWVLGYARNIGFSSPLAAELWAIRDGLVLAIQRGFHNLIVESDSKVAVLLLTKGCVSTHPHSTLILDCRMLMQKIHQIHLVNIVRERNMCADQLAKMGMPLSSSFCIFEFCPPAVAGLCLADAYGAQYVRPP